VASAFFVAVALTNWSASNSVNVPTGQQPLLSGSQVPLSVRSIVERACQDCHSANTHWPWYSKFPPISWKIHKDVARARAFMDFSKWDQYTESERTGFLAAIARATQIHLMPPARYVWLHREARLSDAELRSLQAWASTEREAISSRAALRAQKVGQ
jgi:hypothetical protein